MEILELKNSEPNNPFAPKQDTIFLCEDQLDIDTDSLKKIILVKEKELKEKYPHTEDGFTGLGDSLTSRFQHFNLLDWSETSYLKSVIKETHDLFLETLGYPNDREIYCASWANVMRKGERISAHSHAVNNNSYLGGHICINTKDTHTYYIDPYYKNVYNSINNNGKITLFPNWIEHGTNEVMADMERVTIAFDMIDEVGYNRVYKDETFRWTKL